MSLSFGTLGRVSWFLTEPDDAGLFEMAYAFPWGIHAFFFCWSSEVSKFIILLALHQSWSYVGGPLKFPKYCRSYGALTVDDINPE